jgi:colanic acid biosynthesis glycosyl transferase WcaI
MGKKQALLNVVRAAELTRYDENLVWAIIGEGEERKMIEAEINLHNLSNLRLLPLQPREGMCQMYAAADVLLLSQKALVKDSVIPSKLLTYMSAGRSVLASVSEESETARQIQKARCGIVVPPEDPASLVHGVTTLRSDPLLRSSLGTSGRQYAEVHFTKASVLTAYDQFFQGSSAVQPAIRFIQQEGMASDRRVS